MRLPDRANQSIKFEYFKASFTVNLLYYNVVGLHTFQIVAIFEHVYRLTVTANMHAVAAAVTAAHATLECIDSFNLRATQSATLNE